MVGRLTDAVTPTYILLSALLSLIFARLIFCELRDLKKNYEIDVSRKKVAAKMSKDEKFNDL